MGRQRQKKLQFIPKKRERKRDRERDTHTEHILADGGEKRTERKENLQVLGTFFKHAEKVFTGSSPLYTVQHTLLNTVGAVKVSVPVNYTFTSIIDRLLFFFSS